MKMNSKLLSFYIAFTLALTACGGGGSSSKSGDNDPNDPGTSNNAPTAEAGTPQSVIVGDSVMLDGSSSNDVDGDDLTFSWTISESPENSLAELDDPSLVKPSFTPDLEGAYVMSLTVSDGEANSEEDTVAITASSLNAPPIADAGANQNVQTGTLVTLDGSASSDSDGDMLTYEWTLSSKPNSSLATLSNSTLSSPNFTPDLDGTYTFELVVSDGENSSNPDTVTIVSSTANSAPTADAGPGQNVEVGNTVQLDGTASADADGDPLTYSWSLVSKPALSNATLSNANTSTPTFVPDQDGDYVAQLIVNDAITDSNPDTVAISASTANSAPVANAGPDTQVISGESVTLNGTSSSDADGDSLSYSWSFTSIPAGSGAAISDPSSPTPSFTTDLDGSYVVSLTVNDGEESSSDTVSVTASAPFVTLMRKGSGFFGEYQEVSFPYSSTTNFSASVSGVPAPTSYTLNEFTIQANGTDFTITSVEATDRNGVVSPRFVNLAEDDVLSEGISKTFSVETPLTNNQPVDLLFSFTIQETGETFTAIYKGQTN